MFVKRSISFFSLVLISGILLVGAYKFSLHLDYFKNIGVKGTLLEALSAVLILTDSAMFSVAIAVILYAGHGLYSGEGFLLRLVNDGDRVLNPDWSERVTFSDPVLLFWWDPVFQNGGMFVRHHKLRGIL